MVQQRWSTEQQPLPNNRFPFHGEYARNRQWPTPQPKLCQARPSRRYAFFASPVFTGHLLGGRTVRGLGNHRATSYLHPRVLLREGACVYKAFPTRTGTSGASPRERPQQHVAALAEMHLVSSNDEYRDRRSELHRTCDVKSRPPVHILRNQPTPIVRIRATEPIPVTPCAIAAF